MVVVVAESNEALFLIYNSAAANVYAGYLLSLPCLAPYSSAPINAKAILGYCWMT